MKILLLGSLYPENRSDEIKAKSKFYDYPGNIFQHALIKGLDNYADLKIVTAPSIKRYHNIFLRHSEFSHNGFSSDICLNEIDIPAIKEILLISSFYREIKNIKDIDIIIIYSTSFPALYAASLYKKRIKSVKIINIITDLPEDMSHNNGFIYDTLKSIGIKFYYRYTKFINGYVFLSSKMTERFPIGKSPWVVVEGIYDNSIKVETIQKFKEKTIAYTGALNKRYGIVALLDAFSLIKEDDYRLILCGSGDAVEIIEERQVKDHRIKYLGQLNREEALKIQKQSTILINPRSTKEEYTKYSFPSKTLEYMASGTPTLMTRLQCIPEEYYQYLFFIDDETADGIKNKIIEVCSNTSEELKRFGAKASNFILGNKNSSAQAYKIIQFTSQI